MLQIRGAGHFRDEIDALFEGNLGDAGWKMTAAGAEDNLRIAEVEGAQVARVRHLGDTADDLDG